MTIITYGGGEILAKVFESISMLFYGEKESLMRALMILSASVGGFWVLTEVMISHSGSKLVTKFFMPVLIIFHLLLLPNISIRIEDVTVLHSGDPNKRVSYTIDRVPFILGKLTSIVSSFGYKITQAIESVMHVPDDVSYNRTGHIFGAENLLDATQYRIQNADLENNFRSFVNQCVFYDLALEQYSIDEMKKSTNLWDFFQRNTSKVRGIMYKDPYHKEKTQFCSCKDAISKMRGLFEEEKNFYMKSEVFGRLPLNYQALTGLQQSASELISQQLVINAMTEEINGGKASFATSRAYTKQRETFQILGSLTAKSLITMRNVLEALIYAAFIFIAPLAFLPRGVRYLTTWCSLVIWLQLWPPFFSILNYIMQITSQSKVTAIFGCSPGLSFFTSVGLRDLYSDMHAVAGYLAASIPFITYAILKGGVSSFVHLASSITAPSQSAATSTAEEKASGNYSFGNLSWGNLNAYNSSAFKRHSAPVLSSGYFSEDSGKGGVTYSSDGEIFYKQSKSELRTSIHKSDSFAVALQEAKQDAQTLVDTESEQYSESLNAFASSSASLVEHMANSNQYQEGVQHQIGSSEQQAIHELGNLAEKFGERFGMDRRTSLEVLSSHAVNGGLGAHFKIFNGGVDFSKRHSNTTGASSQEVHDAGQEFVQTEQFQENWQQFLNQSLQMNAQETSDEGARFSQDFQSSFQNIENSQRSLQKALTNMEQLSESISYTQTDNIGVQQNLDHAFVKWASERERSFERAKEVLDREEHDPAKVELIQEFVRSEQWHSIDFERGQVGQESLLEKFREFQMAKPQEQHHSSRMQDMRSEYENMLKPSHGHPKDLHEQLSLESKELFQRQNKQYAENKSDIQERGGGLEKKIQNRVEGNLAQRASSNREFKEVYEDPIELVIQKEEKKLGVKDLLRNLKNIKQED